VRFIVDTKTIPVKNNSIPKHLCKYTKFLFKTVIAFCFLSLLSVEAYSQIITVTVKYSANPGNPKVSLADLKYNKQSVLSMDIDDQPANVMSVKAYLQGGMATEDGLTYPGKFFTDGCGNNKPYSLGIAMTAHSNYNDGDLTLVPSLLNSSQLTSLVASGFLLENHGFYHEQDQYYVSNNFTLPRNILENTNFIYDKTGFVSRVWVTPSNYAGYNPYVQQQGFMAATSQGVTDGYTSQPINMWTDHLADLSQLDSNFNVFLRDFNDDWANTTVTNELKSRINDLRSKSSGTVHKIYRIGTHSYNSSNWEGFKSFFNYVDSTSGNTIWVTSLQEFLEYLEVKKKLVMSQVLKSNVLTLTLDLSKVPVNNSFRDISLLVDNGSAISSVSVSGADGFSYNTSGLVNIFKRKTLFDPPYNKPAPIAGADQEVILPVDSAVLTGKLADTSVHIVSFNWSKVSGPDAGTIVSPSQTTTIVKGLVQGNYVFRLTAIDENGIHGTDDVAINVISIVSPGSVYHVEAENWTTMFGVQTENCSDTGGTLDVGWIDKGDWMDYALTVGTSGSYTLNLRLASPYSGAQLLVKNNSGNILSTVNIPTTGGFQKWQTVSVPVQLIAGKQTLRLESNSTAGWNINWLELVGAIATNQLPTANAGLDQTITLPASSVTLNGSGSDPDGTIATYAWTKVSGAGGSITSPSFASTTVTGLTAGSYTFRLTVTDNGGATAIDDVVINVNAAANQLPTANAGADQTITLPTNSVSLAGSGTDPDGTISTYAWTKVSGTGGSITSPSSPSTTVTGLTAGSYIFRLTVTDNSGATASDDVNITVNSVPTPAFSLKIEAETYTNTTAPVIKSATTDVGGGLQVSSLDNGDVLNYTVDVPYSGTYTVNFRVGATKGGSRLLLQNQAGSLLATINVPNTGAAWQTVSVSINLTAGNAQTFKVVVNKSSGNPVFNWWELNLSSLSAARAASNNRSEVMETTVAGKLQVYPSPVHEQAKIEITDTNEGLLKVQLWNVAGALQKQFIWNKNTPQYHNIIFVGDLPKGEYILRIEINKQVRSEKFIKL
jgi:hypothetical protein